jgi:DNA repair protein RadD
MYTLRDYQKEASDIAIKHLREYQQPFIIQAATGAGKSLIIADIAQRIGGAVLILQPSKELLEQNYAKLKSYGVEDVSIYSASKNTKEIGRFTYATIGSIYKRPDEFKHFKYVIIDECHLVNPKKIDSMYVKFLNDIGCRNVCGLTATPYRLEQKFFKEGGQTFYTSCLKMVNRIYPYFFKKIAFTIETDELIERGYLSPIRYITDDVELENLRVNNTGADYTTESLESFWSDEKLQKLAKVARHVDKSHKRNLIFCSSIRQAERAKQLMDKFDIDSAVVTSKTPAKDREMLVQAFREGKLHHLINVGVFTTGFDVPELDCIILARPTMSLSLYYQMVGRGVRLDPGNPDKKLYVYDLAGCVERLGRVETIKLGKEEDGFRDLVESEVGKMTDMPLFTFQVKSNKFKFTRKEI